MLIKGCDLVFLHTRRSVVVLSCSSILQKKEKNWKTTEVCTGTELVDEASLRVQVKIGHRGETLVR